MHRGLAVNPVRVAALRATSYGLHVAAAFAGAEASLVWLVFHWDPAAVVGGLLWALAGVLVLLSRTSPLRAAFHQRFSQDLSLYAYGAALIAAGGLVARAGAVG